MTQTSNLLSAIKETLNTGKRITVDLREASALTGSGNGQGGRTFFDNAFSALRYGNPIREACRVIPAQGSSVMFVAKTGNAANQTNPWLYAYTADSGSPNTDTTIWQLPTRAITASLPIRTAVMNDVNYLNETLVMDLALEFASIEGASCVINNDQSGTTTTTTGGTSGLRGLNYYTSASASAYGTSGTAITNGIHSIATVTQAGASIAYDDIVNMTAALPPAYWSLPGNAWMMAPSTIQAIRKLKGSSGGAPMFVEVGDDDGGAVAYMFGFPVIPNANMDAVGAGKFSIYLANWPLFVTIADIQEMDIQAMEQSAPGFVTLFAEKRMVSTVRDPFAGVRLVGV
jgi:HK97 family phage major capsid protein